MLLILLLLPLVVFCVLAGAQAGLNRPFNRAAAVSAVVASILSAAVAVWLISSNPKWSASNEIAWTAMESDRAGAPLHVAGSKQDATVGWPSGSFAPELTFRAASEGFQLHIARQTAFLLSGGKVLNGHPIPDGGDVASDGYRVSWYRRNIVQRQMEIRGGNGNAAPIASFRLPAGERDKTISLSALIGPSAIELRRLGRGVEARELEAWASRHWLLARPRESWPGLLAHSVGLRVLPIGDGNTPRLSSEADENDATVARGEPLTVLWSNRSQHFAIAVTDGRLGVKWEAPWVRNSPPPPDSSSRPVPLVVCLTPLPGETAFTLPFGASLGNTRRRLFYLQDRFVEREEAPEVELSKYAPKPDTPATTAQGRRARSEAAVDTGPYILRLTSLADMPSTMRLCFILLVGVAMLGAGLFFHVALPPDGPAVRRQPWLAAGVALSFWTFLLLRFVLAIRYALDPGAIDQLSAGGVESAALALMVMPGLLLLAVLGVRRTIEAGEGAAQWAQARRALFHTIALVAAVFVSTALTRRLWPNLPDRFFPRYNFWWSPEGALACAFAIIVAGLFLHGQFAPAGREIAWLKRIAGAAAAPIRVYERMLPAAGRRMWPNLLVNREPGVRRPAEEVERSRHFLFSLTVLTGALAVVFLLLFLLQRVLPPSAKLLQEVVTPLLFFWIPGGLLLALRLRGDDSSIASGLRDTLSWPRAAATIGVIFLAVFFLPIAVRDAGGLLAAAAVFASVTMVLLASGPPRHLGWMCVVFLFAAIGAAVYLFLNVNALASTPGAIGESRVRLLVFRDSDSLKSGLLWFSLRQDESAGVVSEQKVSNALEHTWENQAIAHEGGWWGLGFGNAPTRRSQIRQDTVQFDSAFSFYIASEYGLFGGLFLLLCYLAPLALVLPALPPGSGLGPAFAGAIAGAFFLEAAFHALMNYGALPFTGRDLPMLAVNSGSDVWRWLLLFALLLQACYWETPRSTGLPVTAAPRNAQRAVWIRSAIVCLLPLCALGWLAVRGIEIARDNAVSTLFDWSPQLREVNALALRRELTYDRRQHRIVFKKPPGFEGATLLEQEIERFNSLTDPEKLEGLLAHHPKGYVDRLAQLRKREDWDDLMNSFRLEDDQSARPLRPSLFRLVRAGARAEGEDEAGNESENDEPAVEEDTTAQQTSIPELNEPLEVRANPEFNTRVAFTADTSPQQMPVVRWSGVHSGSWSVRGESFEFVVPVDAGTRERSITLASDGKTWKLAETVGPESRRVAVWLRAAKPGTKRATREYLGVFEAGMEHLTFLPAQAIGRKLDSILPWKDKLVTGKAVSLLPGDRIRIAAENLPKDSRDFTAERVSQSALVGPAWVRGEWISAFDPDRRIPWIAYVARALPHEYRRLGGKAETQYGSLTLDPVLQNAASMFVSEAGRELHEKRIGRRQAPQYKLPPRVALAVIRIPNGETLALGGWPRMSSLPYWFRDPDTEEWVPPLSWIEESSPASVRARYGGDRNFEKMLMGSTTKPLWASVVLALHAGLARHLAVRGEGPMENDPFGIVVGSPTKGWEVPNSRGLDGSEWCDLTSYLAHSDNRFQVRLGLLGLAEPGANGLPAAFEGEASPSVRESMDGGGAAWRKYPRFPLEIKFNHKNPNVMGGLAETPLADRWHKVFGVGVHSGDIWYRTSFWSGQESDDIRPRDHGRVAASAGATTLLDAISPEAPDFAFDSITEPRRYISMLLGGATNMWSNVDFAGAFATAVTGQTILPHITPPHVTLNADRVAPAAEAAMIRPGTNAVLARSSGTGFRAFHRALPILRQFGEVYGKSGTLQPRKGVEQTSRMVVAVVRWSADRKRVEDGLVFSLVAERGGKGTAAIWLADFIAQNEAAIRRILEGKK